MKLLYVHVPKAGGTSIFKATSTAFAGRILLDTEDDPANPLSTRNIDPVAYFCSRRIFDDGIDCIHGHFHPGKYQLNKDTIAATLLRNPVDNLISIYFYWKKFTYFTHYLHEYVIRNDLDIIQFARLPLLRFLYSRTYFGQFDMGRFDLIGRHEDRDRTLARLSELVSVTFSSEVRENITPPSLERLELLEDKAKMARLTDLLTDDLHFYERYAV